MSKMVELRNSQGEVQEFRANQLQPGLLAAIDAAEAWGDEPQWAGCNYTHGLTRIYKDGTWATWSYVPELKTYDVTVVHVEHVEAKTAGEAEDEALARFDSLYGPNPPARVTRMEEV